MTATDMCCVCIGCTIMVSYMCCIFDVNSIGFGLQSLAKNHHENACPGAVMLFEEFQTSLYELADIW
jgi:hypothetical protein